MRQEFGKSGEKGANRENGEKPHVPEKKGNTAMVRIGIVGVGFMGMIHYLAARTVKGARVTAVCSRDPKKLAGDWRGIRGNFGPAGQRMDLGELKKYRHVDDLVADPEIDLVDICNPTHLHAATALTALGAGKHVLVEKAIALEPQEADAMIKAARQAGKLLMVAHVLPFFPEFAFAAEAIRGGRHGRLLGAHFKRVISRPDWSADVADPAKTGGPAVDLHIHDTHFIGLVCGVPRRVFALGVMEKGHVQYLTTQYLYGKSGPCVTCSSGAVAQKGRMFVHGFEIYLERATLGYESGSLPLTVWTPDGRARQPKLKGGADATSAFTTEIQAAVNGVRSGREPDLLSGRLARNALVMCHKECQSVRTGKAVALA
jgi:predicted dehydrogenase